MTVTINEQPMEFSLEEEGTVGEILGSIEAWLENEGYSLSALAIDNTPVAANLLEEHCARTLDGIERIDIRACTWAELLAEALGTTIEVLEEEEKLLLLAPDAANRERFAAIAEGWLESAAASFLSGRDRELFNQVKACLTPESSLSLKAMLAILGERRREIAAPVAELASIGKILEEVTVKLENVPLELQTGKDADAGKTLQMFAELFGKIVRIIPLLRFSGIDMEAARIGETGFKDYIEELSAALRELVDGFESGDAILVGDIAEYELAPRLRNLCPVLGDISGA